MDSCTKRPLIKQICLFLTAAITIAVFFHAQIINGFSLLFGDHYDAVIEIAILEHWYNVVRGLAVWTTTNYYYPHANTLAYNDGYLLYGLNYSLFRGIGFDPFLAAEYVNITTKFIGFFAFYAAMRQIMRVDYGWAILGAAVFTLGNSTLLHAAHAQLLSVAYAPLLALSLYHFMQAYRNEDHKKIILWGGLSALFFALWLMTAYYMAWFFAYLGLILVIVFAIKKRSQYPIWLSSLRKLALPLFIVACIALCCLAPFVWLYLPKSIETARHHTASWSPALLDIFNIGNGNLLFGSIWQSVNETLRPESLTKNMYELTTGMPPILLGLFLLAVWTARRDSTGKNSTLLWIFIIALLLSWFLTLHIIGWNGKKWTLWKFAHQIIPGASGIRTAARYQIFLSAPVIALAVAYLATKQKQWGIVIASLLAGLLLLEQVNLAPPIALNRPQELAQLQSLPSPPPTCRAFYTYASRNSGNETDNLYGHNVPAMLIAEYINLPTINGVSTYNPPDWNFAKADLADYLDRVNTYAKAHKINDLCGLNLTTLEWRT